MAAKVFHPLLALIASATNSELARYVEFLKEENKILRARIPGQVHTRKDERPRLIKFGKALGRAVEDERVHEAVGTAVGDLLGRETEPLEVAHVVLGLQVPGDLLAGSAARLDCRG